MTVFRTEPPAVAYFEEIEGGYVYYPSLNEGGYTITRDEQQQLAKAYGSIRTRLTWEAALATIFAIALFGFIAHDANWRYALGVVFAGTMIANVFRHIARLDRVRQEILRGRACDPWVWKRS